MVVNTKLLTSEELEIKSLMLSRTMKQFPMSNKNRRCLYIFNKL